jgi:hypothetical protein
MRTTPLAVLAAFLIAPACMPVPPEAPASAPPETASTAAKVSAAPEAKGSIESIEYAGSGCDESTTTTAISPDGQASTSIFSAFVASVEPDSDPDEAAKSCVLIMKVKVPAGWSYTFNNVIYRGFAGLEEDVTATRQSLYFISGSPAHVTPTAEFEGEINDNYTHADVNPDAPGEWSPCGGGQQAWIVTQTEVDNSEDEDRGGQLTVDSLDTELRWKRCR